MLIRVTVQCHLSPQLLCQKIQNFVFSYLSNWRCHFPLLLVSQEPAVHTVSTERPQVHCPLFWVWSHDFSLQLDINIFQMESSTVSVLLCHLRAFSGSSHPTHEIHNRVKLEKGGWYLGNKLIPPPFVSQETEAQKI